MAKFIKKRFPAFFVVSYLIIAVVLIGFSAYPNIFLEASESASWINNGASAVTFGPYAGDYTLVLDLTMPNPIMDSAIDDGSVTVTDGDTLTSFIIGEEKFADNDHDDDQADYENGFLIVNSADDEISSGEIITPGTASLTAFSSVEGSIEIFIDHGTDNDAYDDGEDIFVQVHNGTDVYANGSSINAFIQPLNAFYDDTGVSSGDYDEGEAIINDVDFDGFPSAGDTVATVGGAKVQALTADDNVCFDKSAVLEATEYDYNPPQQDEIYYDASDPFDCSDGFNSGTDIILVGNNTPTGSTPYTEFGTEQEVAFLDTNKDSSYTCARDSTCEPLVYSGVNGVNLADDDDLPLTTVFFDSSTGKTGSAREVAIAWDETDGAGNLTSFMEATSTFGYVSGIGYADGDDIFKLVENGISAVFAGGSESRLFGANDKYSDTDGSVAYSVNELVVNSADSILEDAEIVTPGTIDLSSFSLKYFDESLDSVYDDGEDIITDIDGSGYYNADKLSSIIINNDSGTATDDDIYVIDIWEEEGTTLGFQSDEDTPLGWDYEAPMFNQAIDVSALSSVFLSGSSEQRIYVTVYTVEFPTHGATLQVNLPVGGADFASATGITETELDGPSDLALENVSIQTIDSEIAITDENISITSSGSGTDGTYIIGDTVIARWDNSATGDNNIDLDSATVDFSSFWGDGAVAMEDDGAGGTCDDGDAADEIYCAAYTILIGWTDDINYNISVTATDIRSNTDTVSDTSNFAVDNNPPTVTGDNISVTGATGTGDVFKNGDIAVPTWDVTAEGETDTLASVTFNVTDFRTGDVALVGVLEGGIYTTSLSGAMTAQDDLGNVVSVTVIDNAGNVTTTSGANDYTIDTILPEIATADMQDTTGDGIIDRIAFTMSENLADTASGANGFNITSAANHGACADEIADPAVSDALNLDFTCSSQYTAVGDMKMTLTANDGVVDDAGNGVATVILTSETVPAITDGASPIFLSASTDDNNSDGTVDRLVMTFSEEVVVTDGGTDNDITLVDSEAGTTTVTAGTYGTTASTLTYTITTSVTDNTSFTIDPTYATAGAGRITDSSAALNEMANEETVTGTDGAAPAVLTRVYQDNGANGSVDRVVLTMSEDVTFTSANLLSDFAITANDLTGFGGAITDIAGTGTSTMTFTVTATDNLTGVSDLTEPQIAFTDDTTNHVTDGTNNLADFTVATITDAAIPVRYGNITYSDNGGDGSVDRVTLVYTEKVTYTYVDTEWVAAAEGLTGFDVTACTSCADVTSVVLTATATANITGVSGGTEPTLAYTYASQYISDATGNDAASIGVTSLTDGASPIFLSASTDDNNSDGTVDRLTMTFSEPVTVTDGGTDDDITLAASTGTATVTAGTYDAVGTTTLTYVISVSATGNTALTISPTYATGGAGNISDTVNEMANEETVTGTDGAAPAVLTATFYNATTPTDGRLDLITVVWSENISKVADGTDDWALTSAANFAGIAEGTVVCSTGTAGENECDYNFTTTTAKTDVGDLSLAYTGVSVTDGANTATSKTITSASSPAFTDGAAPVIITTSPVTTTEDIEADADIVLTFSEVMTTDSLEASTSPVVVLGSATWSVGDTVATYTSHADFDGGTLYTFTVSAAESFVGDDSLVAGPVANPFTFTTVSLGRPGGAGGGGSDTNAIIASGVISPNGGESWAGNSSQNITWISRGAGISKIKLSYSLDGGSSYPYVIASSESNDGSYTWTVPNISSSSAKVKVEAISSAEGIISSDISNANFTITAVVPSISTTLSTIIASPTSVVANGTSTSTITVTAMNDSGVAVSGKTVSLTSSRGASDTITPATATTDATGLATFTVLSSTAGTSTHTASVDGNTLSGTATVSFTAESSSDSDTGEDADTAPTETPISLSVGDRIKSSLSTSVYFYGSDNKRHLFPNEKTYKSWYTDWTGVKIVPVSQLQGISLGHNVTIRPGTVLLKIETDPKVYAVEPTGLLRWVPTEARALALYGSNWNTQIIDVPHIYWVDYTFGADITTDQHPSGTLIQYTGTTEVYYVQGSEKRHFTGAAFEANRYQSKYVETIPEIISYTNGAEIIEEEEELVRIY